MTKEENTKEINTLPIESPDQDKEQDIKVPVKRKAGRPPGAKNKDTIFKELMKEDFQALATTEVKKVFKVLFEKAQDGDIQAIKLVLDRVIPPNKAVDIAEKGGSGLSVSITIGNLEESPIITGEVIEDGEFEVMDDE